MVYTYNLHAWKFKIPLAKKFHPHNTLCIITIQIIVIIDNILY